MIPTSCTTVTCKLSPLILVTVFLLLNQPRILQQTGVAAELILTPMWSITANDSDICNINISIQAENQNYILNGSLSNRCDLRITATDASAALIQPQQPLSGTDFVYIERQDTACPDKFIRIDGRNDGACNTVVFDHRFTVHIQGGVSLLISDVPASQQDQSRCGDEDGEFQSSSVSQTAPYCYVTRYSDVYPCTVDDIGTCTLRFQSNCNAILGYREVTSHHCLAIQSDKKSLIPYPYNVRRLRLSEQNITEIAVNAFSGLTDLYILVLRQNNIQTLSTGVFEALYKLEVLILRHNYLVNLDDPKLFLNLERLRNLNLQSNQLVSLHPNLFRNLRSIEKFELNNNSLVSLDNGIFRGLITLKELDLSDNLLSKLSIGLFQGLYNLKTLLLHNNYVTEFEYQLFQDLKNVIVLSLAYNKLKAVHSNLFENMKALSFLDFSGNKLQSVPGINSLTSLNHLNLEGSQFKSVNTQAFSMLRQPADLLVSQPEICLCYTPEGVNCSSNVPRSPYLTCDRLLSDRALLVVMWLIGLSAIVGNAFVLWWRNTHVTKYRVQSRLLLNLAASDLLMGVYMIIIASADIRFGESFPVQAEAWRTGITCRFSGVLSIVSSEASVLFVTMISVDRFISIKYPSTRFKFGQRSVLVAVFLIWVFTGALGLIPAVLSGSNPYFYDNSHVCIGIPLALVTSYSTSNFQKKIILNQYLSFDIKFTKTQLMGSSPGLHYATAVFIGLNSVCYLIVLCCYIEILRIVYKAAKRDGLDKVMREQLNLTSRVTAIVATDFLCWCPIIVLGILVQTEVLTLPPSVFAWTVTFILPLNSAINPYLYTVVEVVSGRSKQVDHSLNSAVTEDQEAVDERNTGHSAQQSAQPTVQSMSNGQVQEMVALHESTKNVSAVTHLHDVDLS